MIGISTSNNRRSLSKERLFAKADVFKTRLSDLDFKITIAEDKAEVGGGSYPASYLDSVIVTSMNFQ